MSVRALAFANKSGFSVCLGLGLVLLAFGCGSETPTPAGPEPDADNPIVLTTSLQAKTFKIGDTLKLAWKIDSNTVANGVTIELSLDGGSEYTMIQNQNGVPIETLPVSARENAWVIAPHILRQGTEEVSTVSDSCVIRVIEYDTEHIAQSSGFFRITSQ